MAVEVLTVATAKPGLTKMGYLFRFKETPCSWSSVYSPPNWVIIRVTGTTIPQVNHFLDTWPKIFTYAIVNENELGYRIRVEVDPSVISVSGVNKNLRTNMKIYIRDTYDAVVVSYEDYKAVIDIPKPLPDGMTFADMKEDINDKFVERIAIRRYRFSNTMVALAVSAGGLLEITKAEALADIIDELEL